jgi:2-dehydro-3-deoxyphosphogalactonate aldolase
MIRSALTTMPVIAILRGIAPDEAVAVGCELVAAGLTIIEVPLNSPQPLVSIERLAAELGHRCLIGAGTVMSPESVADVKAAGGRLIVMPHADPAVIDAAKSAGLECIPGVATPTEAFAALAGGADGLKMFPAEMLGPPVLKAWRAVLPRTSLLIPVGGVSSSNIAAYKAAGANGYGIGSALYAPGMAPAEVARRATALVATCRALEGSHQENSNEGT